MATVPIAGGQVALHWPGTLPPPRIEEDTAVFGSVLAGVDLRVRALADGFFWVLVVHDAQAAANPALEQLRFGLSASGVTVRERVGGGFEVVDGAGAPVLSSGEALMWDASGVPARARTAEPGEPDDSWMESAPDLSRKAELPTTVQGEELVIEPDLGLLRGSETRYPVVIDPFTTINKIRWGYANSTDANRNDGIVRAGRNPDGSGNYRSFFAFNLASLAGKSIRSAKFMTELTHSWSCTGTPVNLWRTEDLTVAGRSAWDGPNLLVRLQELSGHAHKPDGSPDCGDDPQPDMFMEFGAAALRIDIDALKGDSNYTLALSTRRSDGTGESTTEWWKKFDQAQTKLSVEYNSWPNTPTAAQLSTHADYTAAAQACASGTGRPIVRSTTPWLKARLTDPDGVNGGLLSGSFTLQRWDGAAWAGVANWPKTDGGVPHNSLAELQITAGVTGNDRFRWQVQTTDTLGGASGASPWCEFDIDGTPPGATPSVGSADGVYLEFPANIEPRGALGRSGRFTFGANGATDVVDYVYQLNAGAERVVAAAGLGGPATVWVTPTLLRENVLTVRSRDQAGNRSAPRDYTFLVAEPSAPMAVWGLNEGTGTALATTPPGGPSATLSGGATWTDSRVLGTHENTGKDWAVRFDGLDDQAATSAAVLDTTRSFSVSAWVRPTASTGTRTVVSQVGSVFSAFYLQRTAAGTWAFVMSANDQTANTVFAESATPARLDAWTHLAGGYDAHGAQMRLYVNGQLAATRTRPGVWGASGPLFIGRSLHNGVPADRWQGDVAEVRVWDRVIDPDLDLKALVAPVLAGAWEMEDFDEEAPRQASDESGYQRPVSLTDAPSAQWCDGFNFSVGLCFNGTGSADTAGPVLHTDQSFTVSAWLQVPSSSDDALRIAVSQGTVNVHAMRIGYNGATDEFLFRVVRADGPGAGGSTVSHAAPGTWVHVAAVWDATTSQIRLYLNGVRTNEVALPETWAPFDATGPLNIGRNRADGVWKDFWVGGLDRVRVWAGVLSDNDISALFSES